MGMLAERQQHQTVGMDRVAILGVSGNAGWEAGPRARSQIPNFLTNPELTKCETNVVTNYCKSLPTHGRNTVTSALFILFVPFPVPLSFLRNYSNLG